MLGLEPFHRTGLTRMACRESRFAAHPPALLAKPRAGVPVSYGLPMTRVKASTGRTSEARWEVLTVDHGAPTSKPSNNQLVPGTGVGGETTAGATALRRALPEDRDSLGTDFQESTRGYASSLLGLSGSCI